MYADDGKEAMDEFFSKMTPFVEGFLDLGVIPEAVKATMKNTWLEGMVRGGISRASTPNGLSMLKVRLMGNTRYVFFEIPTTWMAIATGIGKAPDELIESASMEEFSRRISSLDATELKKLTAHGAKLYTMKAVKDDVSDVTIYVMGVLQQFK